MGRGRPPKPTKLKILTGNPGKRPLNENEPKPKGTAKCPPWLSKEARDFWRRQAPDLERMGLLTQADECAFAVLCQAWADYRRCVQYLTRHGHTYEADSGYSQSRPEVGQRAKAEETIGKFGARFGLDPASRTRLQTYEPASDDPFDQFLRGAQ